MEVWREMEMEAILSDVEEAIGSEVGDGGEALPSTLSISPAAMFDRHDG